MKKFLEHPVLKILLNQYVLTGLLFAVWMVFLDANNYFIHSELDQQIESLEADIEFYETSQNTTVSFFSSSIPIRKPLKPMPVKISGCTKKAKL